MSLLVFGYTAAILSVRNIDGVLGSRKQLKPYSLAGQTLTQTEKGFGVGVAGILTRCFSITSGQEGKGSRPCYDKTAGAERLPQASCSVVIEKKNTLLTFYTHPVNILYTSTKFTIGSCLLA